MNFEPAILTIFWFSLAAILYVYFGYPLLLRLGFFGRAKPLNLGPIPAQQPMISVIIAARNEEKGIEAKLKNLLASAYPRERMEILVGSDGSSDRTESIVRPLASEGVGLISFPMHQGKSAMQNRLVAAASGSILIFTDADCILQPDALYHLVSNFRDPAVGLVTGRPVYLNRSATDITENETGYLRYETNIRMEESARGILAVASGSLFALRRNLWKPLDSNLGDDFVLPLYVAKTGFRNILEPRAVAATRLSQSSPASMLRLKLRIVSKDFRAILTGPGMLNPFKQGRTAIGLWSHKLLRWFVPYFLITILASAVYLSAHPIFRILTAAQIAFYGIALAGLLPHERPIRSPWSIPTSFCIVNLAALLGTMRSLTGRPSGRWEPERKQSPIESAQQGAALSAQSK